MSIAAVAGNMEVPGGCNHSAEALVFLDHGAEMNTAQIRFGHTHCSNHLPVAVQFSYQDAIELLIQEGADINLGCLGEWTDIALQAAAAWRYEKLLLPLVELGPNLGKNLSAPRYDYCNTRTCRCVVVNA